MEKEFFDFVYQRQLIWHKRFVLRQKPPWTDDQILKEYKIINVYRELDKGTLYILEKLKEIRDRKALLINTAFYRFFNRYGLYEDLGIEPFMDFNDKLKERLAGRLSMMKKRGKTLFNDAYLIAGKKGQEKYASVLDSLSWLNKHAGEITMKIDNSGKPEESFEALREIPLVGSFLAYEIWTDLAYFGFFRQGWTENDFVSIGPGAKTGLEIIYGKSSIENLGKLHLLQKDFLSKYKNPSWEEISYKKAFVKGPFLSIANIENALCEFRKYHNLKNGKGKRRKFHLS